MWRKAIPILALLLALLMSFGLNYAKPLQQEGNLDTTTTRRVKLRAGPGIEWAILGVVEAGEAVRLDGRAPYENLWVRGITTDGRIGWMFGDYIAAPVEQLVGLRTIWVDDPFTLSVPVAEASIVISEPSAHPPSFRVISGVTATSRAIFRRGQELGNRANVFSKVGDSITATPYFLRPIGWGMYNLRSYSNLQPVVDYFVSESARDGNNSFANPSIAANSGWTTNTVLDPSSAWPEVCFPGETPLVCEYRLVKPSVALIMLGTNDVVNVPVETFRATLSSIVQTSIDLGVIPVLSTIPLRQGYESTASAFNQVIMDTAHYYDVPLWDYASALQGLENNGLWDGIHPAFPPSDVPDNYPLACDFTSENLRYGMTIRNLTALQALDAVWRRAIQ